MDRVLAGLLGLIAATPLFLLNIFLPFAYWAGVGVLLWLFRSDPALRRGVLPALATLVLLAAVALASVGLTVGTQEGALFVVDGPPERLALTALLIPVAPAAILLALGPPGPARALSRWAMLAFALAVLGGVVSAFRDVRSGAAAEATSLALLATAVGWLFGLAALLGATWLRWRATRPPPAQAPPTPAQT